MAFKLKEVTLVNATNAYASEFFASVAKQPEGRFFAFEQDLPETTIRSRAQIAGKALGVKFTVATVKAGPGEKDGYAVGVTTKVRKPRGANKPKTAESNAAEQPEESRPELAEPDTTDRIEAFEDLVSEQGV